MAMAMLARRAIVDIPTLVFGLGTLALVSRFKIPEPLAILAAAVLGIAVFSGKDH